MAVEHISDPPIVSDDTLRATKMELVSTLRELMQMHPLYNEQLRGFAAFGGDFEDPARLADVCCSLTSAEGEQLQRILEELSVPDRYLPGSFLRRVSECQTTFFVCLQPQPCL